MMANDEKPGGSTPSQYGLPADATELQDLIEHREMNFARGNMFKALYRAGTCNHSDELRDARKVLWFAQREVERLERELTSGRSLDDLRNALDGTVYGTNPCAEIPLKGPLLNPDREEMPLTATQIKKDWKEWGKGGEIRNGFGGEIVTPEEAAEIEAAAMAGNRRRAEMTVEDTIRKNAVQRIRDEEVKRYGTPMHDREEQRLRALKHSLQIPEMETLG